MTRTFDEPKVLCEALANHIVQLSDESIADHGKFYIALAGGSTPRQLYELLAQPKWSGEIDWFGWEVYFSDERLVPLYSPDSNFKLTYDSFLSVLPLEQSQIHVASNTQKAGVTIAREYEHDICSQLPSYKGLPQFDLILLGLGSDGHTASLFPGMPTLQEKHRLVVPSPPGELPPDVYRVTFTLPLINAARNVAFMVTGQDKKEALAESISSAGRTPAAMVRPKWGALTWYIEEPRSD